MTYKNHVVCAVKVGGKVLRESGDVVTLPFGSEYSLFFKNLNSVRVQIKVSIDGTDATEDTWIIIQPNSSLELERFIKNGNLSSGNRFKFIERSQEIEDHRGIGAEDGIIRVEYKTERVQPEIAIPRIKYYDEWYPGPHPRWPYDSWPYRRYEVTCDNSIRGSLGGASAAFTQHTTSSQNSQNVQAMNLCRSSVPVADAGITVAGAESNQKFVPGTWFATESQSDVIVMRLRGMIGIEEVTAPVTVDCKPKCVTCGRTNKGSAKFCSGCGTALTII